MDGLNQDPTPVISAVIFIILLSAAGIGISLAYLTLKENETIRSKIGHKTIDWLLKQ